MNRCHIKTKIFRKQISGLPDHFGVRAAVCKPVIFFQFKPTHINPGFFNQAFKRKWTGIPERETAILRVLETRGGVLADNHRLRRSKKEREAEVGKLDLARKERWPDLYCAESQRLAGADSVDAP